MKRVGEYICVIVVSSQLLGASTVRAEKGLRGEGQISFNFQHLHRKNKIIPRPSML